MGELVSIRFSDRKETENTVKTDYPKFEKIIFDKKESYPSMKLNYTTKSQYLTPSKFAFLNGVIAYVAGCKAYSLFSHI